jgi:ribosomal-protein-alanine N-acetyltransferase
MKVTYSSDNVKAKTEIITTQRLILRPLEDHDLEVYAEIMTQDKVTRFLGNGQKKSKEDVKQLLERFQKIQREHALILHALVKKDTNQLIGHCGYLPLLDKKGYELLYAIEPSFWGKGYATEAGAAAISYAKDHYDWDRIYAMVYPENLASRKVLLKLGFVHEAYEEHSGNDIELLVLKLR